MKKNYFYNCMFVLVVLIFMINLLVFVQAAKSNSPNGEVLAEYPGKIDSYRPFQIKLTLNDSEVQKYANAIIADNNCYYYRIMPDGVKFLPLDSEADKRWAQYIEYENEKEVVITLQTSRSAPIEYTGSEDVCTLRFFFLPTEESQKNPPVMKNGRTLNEKTLLTEVTIKPVRSNYSTTMNLPEGVEKYHYSTMYNMFASKYSANNDGIAYNINAQIMRYGNNLNDDGTAYYYNIEWKFDPYNVDYKKHFEMTTKNNWFAGNMFDKESDAKKLEIGPFEKIKVEDAYYRTATTVYDTQDYGRADKKDMVQVKVMLHGQAFLKHAFINFKFEKTVDTEKGTEDSVMDAAEQDLLAIAKSYMIKTQQVDEMIFVADKEKPKVEKIKDPVIFGTIADGFNNPMPYMKLTVYVGRDEFETTTEETGDFKITLTGKEIEEGKELEVKLAPEFSYNRDGKNYFRIMYLSPPDRAYFIVELTEKMNLTEQNTEVHMVLDGKPNPLMTVSKGINQWEQIKSLSVMYYHFHESVDFALKKLNTNIDYKLPVDVLVGNTQDKTLYSPTNSDILISLQDSTFSSSDRPKNREYHEFAHHIMYATYGAWPSGRQAADVVNHDGFLNSNTADSYIEGFAEFIAMAISKEVGDRTPEIYASFGSQENNYKPWDAMGYDEEFAVSSLLWDLYDNKNDAGDTVSFMLDDIWKVLKVNRKDFYEYYKAFIDANPGKKAQIDTLFVSHGFFANPDVGNKKRDSFEGYRDSNNDKNFTSGEFFVDFGANSTVQLKYRNGMNIGTSANYERINRTSAVRIPNAYIKIPDSSVRWYKVKVDLKDQSLGEDYEYLVDLRDGLIYVQPLPSGYEADITITPNSQDYTSQKPYKTTATKLMQDIEKSTKGYIAEHNFELKSTGKNVDPEYYLSEGIEPTYAYEGDLGDLEGVDINKAEESSSGSTTWIIILIIIFVLVGVGYFLIKKNKHSRKK